MTDADLNPGHQASEPVFFALYHTKFQSYYAFNTFRYSVVGIQSEVLLTAISIINLRRGRMLRRASALTKDSIEFAP